MYKMVYETETWQFLEIILPRVEKHFSITTVRLGFKCDQMNDFQSTRHVFAQQGQDDNFRIEALTTGRSNPVATAPSVGSKNSVEDKKLIY